MNLILPPAVRSGDRIGIAALSGPVDAGRLARGMAALEALGFEPVLADNLSPERLDEAAGTLFAGPGPERLAAFHRLAADPSIRGVLFARGGYGVMRLLGGIDWELLARHPRPYVGYSDLTPFLSAVVTRLGWVAYHGPMVAADLARGLSEVEERSLLAALAAEPETAWPVSRWLRPGRAEAPLLGGCLSLLTATLGTPWETPTAGAVLFWEDVAEPRYRLDRMLTHLGLSGRLARIRGMVVGHATPADLDGTVEGEDALAKTLSEVLDQVLPEAMATPVALGLPAGHEAPNRTLPLGWTVRLDADEGSVTFAG